MKIKIYQVDAFTDKLFSGNPAAVCPLEQWLSDESMQKIAMENNLSETAFYIKSGEEYQIRWFTPVVEVDLCGHATLATAHVLFNHENHSGDNISFHSQRSGKLNVNRQGELITLNFPTDVPKKIELTNELTDAFDIKPKEMYKGKTDYMLVYENENQVIKLQVDFRTLLKTNARGVMVTAKGDNSDFVSRFFAPQSGVNEDPVTGSAHTVLIPYWAKTLGKNELTAVQLSKRRGFLKCKFLNERVDISGKAKTYMIGEIDLE